MTTPDRPPYPTRPILFIALMAMGLGYVAAFVWLKQNSRDFVNAELDARARSAAMQLLAPAETLSFGSEGNAVALLGEGWSMPSPDGIWTREDGGVIYLPAWAGGKAMHLAFAAHFYGGEEPLWVRLDVDGRLLAEWNPTASSHKVVADVRLPAASVAGQPLRLEFRIERNAALIWHGVDPGTRTYGIRLTTIQIGESSAAD